MVVWTSYGSAGTDTSYWSTQGQRYASDGSVQGGEFQVNTYTTSSQRYGAVAADADGGFVVVWESNGSSGTDTGYTGFYSVQGQRYASDGSVQGGEFQINTYTTSFQGNGTVAAAANGDFVVAWESGGSPETDSYYQSIQGQRYASDGSALGGQFQVNTYTTDAQIRASVSAAGDGDFVVVWQSDAGLGGDEEFRIIAQGLDPDGEIKGQRFSVAAMKVPSLSPSSAAAAAVLMLAAVAIAFRRRA